MSEIHIDTLMGIHPQDRPKAENWLDELEDMGPSGPFRRYLDLLDRAPESLLNSGEYHFLLGFVSGRTTQRNYGDHGIY